MQHHGGGQAGPADGSQAGGGTSVTEPRLMSSPLLSRCDRSVPVRPADRLGGVSSAHFNLQAAQDGCRDPAEQAGDPLLQEKTRRRRGGTL